MGRRLGRKLVKITAYGALALLGLMILLYVTVVNPLYEPLRDALVRRVTALVSGSLHGSVEIGALRGSLFSAPVLHDVVLRDGQGRVVAQIKAIRLTYHLTALLSGRLQVQMVEIVQPQLTVVETPDGQLNLAAIFAGDSPAPATPAPSGGGLPFALQLDAVHIRDGQMTLGLAAVPGVQQVDGLQLHLAAQMDQAGLRVHLEQGSVRLSPAAVELHTLHGTVLMRDGRVQVDGLRLQTGATLLTAHGVVPGAAEPADFTLQLQPLALAEIGRVLANDSLRDVLHLTVAAQGPAAAIEVHGRLQTPAAQVTLHSQLNLAAQPLQYTAQLDVTHVDLAALLGRADLQSDLNLQLRLHGAGVTASELHSTLQLEVQASHLGPLTIRPSVIHLEVAQQRLQVQRVTLDTSVAQINASGALDLAGPSELQYTLTADLANLRPLLGLQDLAGTLHLQGRAQGTWPELGTQGTLQAEAVRYQEHHLQALQLTYTGTQLGGQPEVSARLHIQQAQAGPLPVAEATLEATYQSTAPQARFALEVRQAADTGGKLRGALTLEATGQQLVLDDLQVQLPQRLWRATAPLRLAFGGQGVQIQQVQLAHAEESITLSGSLAGEHLQDIDLRLTQVDLTYLQQLLALPPAVSGRATVHVQLAGTLAEPRLRSEVSLRAAPQHPLGLEQVRTTLTYAERQLQGALKLQQANREVLALDLRLPLDMAFTGMPLEQRLLEAPLEIRLTLTQPTLPGLTGTLAGTLGVRGTYAALALETDLQLQQLSLPGVVEQVQGPVRLAATVRTAASVVEMAQALQHGQVHVQLQPVTLRLPSLQGQLPAQGAPPQPFAVQDLVAQATAQWTPAGLQASLQRLTLKTTGFGLPRTDLALEAQLTPQRLEVTRLQLRLPQSEVRVQGSITLPEQRLQLRCDIPRLHLADLPVALPAHLPPVVQGGLSVRGSAQAPEVEVELRYASGQIRADLSAALQEPVPRYQATLRLTSLDLAQLLPKAQGRLQANLRLQGSGLTPDQRRASLEMSLDTEGLNLAPGLNVRVQASLAGDTIQLPRMQVRSTPLEVNAQGTLSGTQATALDYRLRFGDLKPLGQYLGLDLQAKGGLTGKVQGIRGVLQNQTTVQIDDLRLDAWRLPRVQADLTVQTLLTAPQATLKAQVTDLQGPSLLPTSVRIDVTRTPQQGNFTVAVTKGPYDKSTIAGILYVAADSQRLLLNTVRLQHRTLAWENAAPLELTRHDQGQVQLHRLAMRSGAQTLTAQGTLVPNGAVQAEVQLQQIQIAPTVQAFAPSAAVPDGRLDLSVALRGSVAQPQIQGELRLSALQWQQQALGDITATFGLRDDTVRTELRWQEQARQLLHIHGSAGLAPQAPLDLRLQSTAFDMARLATLVPAITRSAGQLDLDVHLAGTLAKPQGRGQIAWQDGELQLAATGEAYKDVQMRLLLEPDRLDIAQFQIGSRTGPLQISGQIQHRDLALQYVDLVVRAQQFTAMHTPAIQAVIGADVQARGPQDALTLNGTLSIPQARILLKNLPGSGPKAVEPWELTVPGVYGRKRPGVTPAQTPAAAQASTPDMLSLLQANLTLDIPKNVWVQGSGTAVEMRGALQVTKERQAPFIISGAVETVRGFASFYGKKFVLSQGQVTFTGSPEINPLLDVLVTRKVSEYLVSIRAGGKALQPEITMTSVPPLEQIDIVSLLVVGKTTDKLTGGEQGSVAKQAQQLAGGVVASQLEGVASEALGLDTVELSTESAKVGRYVTQDLFLSYERGLGGKDNGNTVGAEYSLSRRVKVKGSSSDKGETALDVFWRLDY